MATLPLSDTYDESIAFSHELATNSEDNAGCPSFDDAGNWDLEQDNFVWPSWSLPLSTEEDKVESSQGFLQQEVYPDFDFATGVYDQFSVPPVTNNPYALEGALDETTIHDKEDAVHNEQQKILEISGEVTTGTDVVSPTCSFAASTPQASSSSSPPGPRTLLRVSPDEAISLFPESSPNLTIVAYEKKSALSKKRPLVGTSSQRPHYQVEKRYRASLNEKFDVLRLCLLNARAYLAVDYHPGMGVTGIGSGGKDMPNTDGGKGEAGGQKTNKSGVLSEAVEYIQYLEKQNDKCRDKVEELEVRLKVSGEALGNDTDSTYSQVGGGGQKGGT